MSSHLSLKTDFLGCAPFSPKSIGGMCPRVGKKKYLQTLTTPGKQIIPSLLLNICIYRIYPQWKRCVFLSQNMRQTFSFSHMSWNKSYNWSCTFKMHRGSAGLSSTKPTSPGPGLLWVRHHQGHTGSGGKCGGHACTAHAIPGQDPDLTPALDACPGGGLCSCTTADPYYSSHDSKATDMFLSLETWFPHRKVWRTVDDLWSS